MADVVCAFAGAECGVEDVSDIVLDPDGTVTRSTDFATTGVASFQVAHFLTGIAGYRAKYQSVVYRYGALACAVHIPLYCLPEPGLTVWPTICGTTEGSGLISRGLIIKRITLSTFRFGLIDAITWTGDGLGVTSDVYNTAVTYRVRINAYNDADDDNDGDSQLLIYDANGTLLETLDFPATAYDVRGTGGFFVGVFFGTVPAASYMVAYVDDIEVKGNNDAAYPTLPIRPKVDLWVPTANGTYFAWANLAGDGNDFAEVDDYGHVPVGGLNDGDTSYISTSTGAAKDTFTSACGLDAGTGIEAVEYCAYAKKTTASGWAKLMTRDPRSFTADAAVSADTVGGKGTLTDTRQNWVVNQWVGYTVTCDSKTFNVASNTNQTLTGVGAWVPSEPADGLAYTMVIDSFDATYWALAATYGYRRRFLATSPNGDPWTVALADSIEHGIYHYLTSTTTYCTAAYKMVAYDGGVVTPPAGVTSWAMMF